MSRKTCTVLIVILGVILTIISHAPEASAGKKETAAPAPPMSRFLIRLTPVHPEAEASDEVKGRIVMHMDYLKTLLSDGKLVWAGMSTDDYTSILLIEATDRGEAERIMAGDPAVSGNVYLAELHPFRVILSRQGP